MKKTLGLLVVFAAVFSMTLTTMPRNASAEVDFDDACDVPGVIQVSTTGPNAFKKTGTDGNDVIRGTSGNDQIFSKKGDDIICGMGGHDFIVTGDGDDTVYGGPGSDDIYTGNQDDTVYAGIDN